MRISRFAFYALTTSIAACGGSVSSSPEGRPPSSGISSPAAARCQPVAATLFTPEPGAILGGLALSGDTLYWTTLDATSSAGASTGSIWKGSTCGGTATRLASGRTKPHSVAVDGSTVLWVENDASLARIDVGGGDVTSVWSPAQSALDSYYLPPDVRLAASAGHVYFSGLHLVCISADDCPQTAIVMDVDEHSGATRTLWSMATADVWYDIAADSEAVYVLPSDTSLLRMPKDGSPPVSIATRSGGLYAESVAVDGDAVDWFGLDGSDWGGFGYLRVATDGSGTQAVPLVKPDGLTRVVVGVDAGTIYFDVGNTDTYGSPQWKFDSVTSGGAPRALAQENVASVAFDDHRLYYVAANCIQAALK